MNPFRLAPAFRFNERKDNDYGRFAKVKRGMRGVYQHCGKKHLHRYMAEFDFRYSNRVALGVDDQERATRALKGVVGKRLTYRGGVDGRTQAQATQ